MSSNWCTVYKIPSNVQENVLSGEFQALAEKYILVWVPEFVKIHFLYSAFLATNNFY